MTDNSVKVLGIFNEEGKLLRVFIDKYEAMEFLMENSDEDNILYVTDGHIELPTIEEDEE